MDDGRIAQVEVIPFSIRGLHPRYLLVKRVERRGDYWQPVTGGVHIGEPLRSAAEREFTEELGITPIVLIPINYTFTFALENGRNITEHVFGAEVAEDNTVTLSAEHSDFRWVDYETALELLRWPNNKLALKQLHTLLSQ